MVGRLGLKPLSVEKVAAAPVGESVKAMLHLRLLKIMIHAHRVRITES